MPLFSSWVSEADLGLQNCIKGQLLISLYLPRNVAQWQNKITSPGSVLTIAKVV